MQIFDPLSREFRSPLRRVRVLIATSISLLILGVIFLIHAPTPIALAAPGVAIQAVTPYALVDNQASTCTADASPHAMYLQINITNTSGSSLTHLQATLNFTTTGFALTGGQLGTIYLGTLAPGASTPVFWFVTYPCTYDTVGNYLVSVTDDTAGSATFSGVLTTRNELTANAGGLVDTASLGPGLYVGQVVTYQVTYNFGNAWKPASSDAQIQPAGNKTFRADCFQLISDTVDSTSFIAGLQPGMNNQLYFLPVNSAGTNNPVVVTFYFRVRCVGTSSPIYPYSDLQSGSQQQKYTANYGASCTLIPCTQTLPPPTNSFQLMKEASARGISSGGSVVYTVTITNSSSISVMLDGITDTLPTASGMPNTTYQGTTIASSVQPSNSSYSPVIGATSTVSWVIMPNTTWSVPALGSIKLIYTVTFPVNSSPADYQNTVTARTGNTEIGIRGVIVGFNKPTVVSLSSVTTSTTDENLPVAGLLLSTFGGILAFSIRWTRKRRS